MIVLFVFVCVWFHLIVADVFVDDDVVVVVDDDVPVVICRCLRVIEAQTS